jgi:hypothetical protein
MAMSIENGESCVQDPMIGLPNDSCFLFRSSIHILISRSASSC